MDFEEAVEQFDALILTNGLGDLWNRLGRHDPVTQTHSRWVAYFASEAHDQLALFPEYQTCFNLGALFHDIGKLCISREILTKKGPLADEELRYVQRGHVVIGSRLLTSLPTLRPFAEGHHLSYSTKRFSREHLEPWQAFGLTVLSVCDITDRMLRGFDGCDYSKSFDFIESELIQTFPKQGEITQAVLSVAAQHINSPLAQGEISDIE